MREKTMYVIFVDFRKAFDSVDWGIALGHTPPFGVPPEGLTALRNLHTNMEGHIAYGENVPQSSPSALE